MPPKVDVHPICPFQIILSLPHRHERFDVKQYDLSIAKVGKIGHTPKENGEKF